MPDFRCVACRTRTRLAVAAVALPTKDRRVEARGEKGTG
jgi:hypothetical protein